MVRVIQGDRGNLEDLAELFAQYRVFYKQSYDIDGARDFIEDRLREADSVLFLALYDNQPAGFTQLYPSFTSVGMKKLWILNDLYVHEDFRKRGVATALFKRVFDYATQSGRTRVILSTDHDNVHAQRLYEKLGFRKEPTFNYEKDIG